MAATHHKADDRRVYRRERGREGTDEAVEFTRNEAWVSSLVFRILSAEHSLSIVGVGYRFVGDCQIQLACELFLKEKGQELVEKNLSRNYIAHLHALFNYGLVSPRQIDDNIKSLIVSFLKHETSSIK